MAIQQSASWMFPVAAMTTSGLDETCHTMLCRAWLVQCLAEPFAWELVLQEACAPRTKLPADIVQQELARLTGQGASRFVGAQGRSARLREIGIALGKPVTLHQVFARVHDKLLNSDGEPTKEFKTLLRKHPHTTEIICVLAARAIALLPREQRVGEDGQALPQVYSAIFLLCWLQCFL